MTSMFKLSDKMDMKHAEQEPLPLPSKLVVSLICNRIWEGCRKATKRKLSEETVFSSSFGDIVICLNACRNICYDPFASIVCYNLKMNTVPPTHTPIKCRTTSFHVINL